MRCVGIHMVAVLSLTTSLASASRRRLWVGGLAERILRGRRSMAHSAEDKPVHFDLFVIGGGSGGIATARRAAGYGCKVGLAETSPALGGTCVNVGCVPKKVMFNAASIAEALHESKQFGFTLPGGFQFDWAKLKSARDTYISRLNGIYQRNLASSGVEHILGTASFASTNNLVVGGKKVSADHILIATGGQPMKLPIPGAEHCIDSDGFFELECLPKKVAVVGAGYIAVELAGVLNALGTETHLCCRGDAALRQHDPSIRDLLDTEMKRQGIQVHAGSVPKQVVKDAETGALTITMMNGKEIAGLDQVLVAIGRSPNVASLGLHQVGVEQAKSGHITTDQYQNTNVQGIYALGDVTGETELTPMAIAAGRRLADRLFGGTPKAKADYDMVPTVFFTHPPIGTVGLTEPEAREKYGDSIKVYNSTFVNLYYGTFDQAPSDKPKSHVKLVCLGPEERVVGLHVIGMGADEMLQGFAVAMKMGATKAQLDACIAIHPTAAEEVVTLPEWGKSGPGNPSHSKL
ncbi:unnamed protein product [Chrysoparadoxa australica]